MLGLVFALLHPAGASDLAETPEPSVTLLRARRDLAPGTLIRREDVELVTVAAKYAPPHTASPDDAIRHVLKERVYAHEILRLERLETTRWRSPYERLQRLVLKADSGEAALLRPGQMVQIDAHRTDDLVQPVAWNLRVHSTTPATADQPATLTVVVTPKKAETLASAEFVLPLSARKQRRIIDGLLPPLFADSEGDGEVILLKNLRRAPSPTHP